MPNPENYDPLRWYEEQGFEGDPERITVDGYNAVMDDRTAYINAANIDGGDFYTNIYIISFTQHPDPNTIEIFQRMLDNWTFNTNLVDDESDLGTCSISRINCVSDDDCSSGYECSDNWKCVPEEQINCYSDSECPTNIFCNSDKAKITRDTERLAQKREIKTVVEEYQEEYGAPPELGAGTYIPGKTTSVWPSWENTLQKGMSEIIPEYSVFNSLPKDPINRLSRCSDADTPNFNQTTCWDEHDKIFSGDLSADPIELPDDYGDSYAYVYKYNSEEDFSVCVNLEWEDDIECD
jgi:hypothetical protein